MKSLRTALALLVGVSSQALGQVPVADTAREAKETQTAGCVARAAVSKGATVQPTQGVKGSMVAPTAATPSAQVGDASVTGLSAGATSTGFGAFSGGTVGGVGLSNVTPPSQATGFPAPSLGPPAVATLGQTVAGISNVATAIQSNGSSLGAAGVAIGTLDAAQAAWSQNTSARIGGASIWGQAIQVASLTLQLRNLALLQQAARASGQAQVMTYNPTQAVLAGGLKAVADNSVVTTAQVPSYAAVLLALSAAQRAATNPTTASPPLWGGAANAQQGSASNAGASTDAK